MRIFIRRVHFDNEHNFPKDKPVLLASNHPNSFLDGVIFEYFYRSRQIYTLARGDAFDSPVANYLMRSMRLLPIYRARDAKAEVARRKNAQTTAEIYDILKNNGTVMIFPEGISYPEKTIRPLKLGTGSMAVEMVKKEDFSLDLHVVPVAVNYSTFFSLRRSVHVTYGKPLRMRELKATIIESDRQGLKEVTQYLNDELDRLVVKTKGERQEEREFLHQVIVNENQKSFKYRLHESWTIDIEKFNSVGDEVLEQVKDYQNKLNEFKVDDGHVIGKQPDFLSYFVALLSLGISLPVYVVWALLWKLTVSQCVRRIKNLTFVDSVILGAGMIMTFIYLLTVALLVWWAVPGFWALFIIVAGIYGGLCWFRTVDGLPYLWKSFRWVGIPLNEREQMVALRHQIIEGLK